MFAYGDDEEIRCLRSFAGSRRRMPASEARNRRSKLSSWTHSSCDSGSAQEFIYSPPLFLKTESGVLVSFLGNSLINMIPHGEVGVGTFPTSFILQGLLAILRLLKETRRNWVFEQSSQTSVVQWYVRKSRRRHLSCLPLPWWMKETNSGTNVVIHATDTPTTIFSPKKSTYCGWSQLKKQIRNNYHWIIGRSNDSQLHSVPFVLVI